MTGRPIQAGVPLELVVAFALDKTQQEAFEASPQGRYYAAMEVALALGLEAVDVARQSMRDVRANWEADREVPQALAKRLSLIGRDLATAGAVGQVVAEPPPEIRVVQ